jgi:broad specificity phosphatase PhoE
MGSVSALPFPSPGENARALLLIRHGETQWNVERRYQGQLDSPLTERGIAQAEAIGRRLAALPEFASAPLIASPLGRARRTAEIICANRRSTVFETDDRLREITLGSWDGLFADEIAARSPGLLDKHGPYEWYFHSADGERYDAFQARLASFLHDARARSIFVIVAHGVVSRVLRGLYAGMPRELALSLPVPQDSVFRLSGGQVETLPV